ncbi:TM0106 family RecB-like putative nuclease [Agrococcus sp. SGAir0287]|uniref:TM0106 family RecB-like putative nuclease n=1 Tax=Agrococcus sp. SGAir0287 TaxID=2070347 RepID=UPI0010CCE604|nr:TM0106 family RecB-like putative nuclease [Agrococcus sp. SGAir0287]QCR20775.1 DNA helicase [Agrococcus sp. SGAir0287]
MFVRDGLLLHSASDLKAASECEFAMLRALDAKLGRIAKVDDDDDPMLARAGRLGDAHEERILQGYRDRAARDASFRVVEIARPDPMTLDGLRAARAASLAALHDGADVVFQATFLDEATGFMGFADFLVREPATDGAWAYAVYDAKLARSAKTTALLQLAAYALELQRECVAVHDEVHLMLGTGETTTHRLADVLPVFAARIARLREQLGQRLDAAEPIAWDTPGVRQCGRCATCTLEVERTRDVLLVAGLRSTQRERLRTAGITTIDALASSEGRVAGIGDAPLASLRLQARMQLAAPVTGVAYSVFDPIPLGRLPEPSPGDVFFDFEGDPLWWDGGSQWGIDYLFGATTYDTVEEAFTAFWAHDLAQERAALEGFLDWLAERRRRWPDLHVYHYAPYERTHLHAIAARHGVREEEVDDILRADLLVDLYPIVRSAVRISESSYSLKRLEPLFMGDRLRDSAVKDGGASIVAYEEVGRLRGDGDDGAADALLAEIGDYNRYDCAATKGLRDWLAARADELGVPRWRRVEVEGTASARLDAREDAVDARLRARIEGVPADERDDEARATALAAAAVEYHRREDVAYWVMHFERLRSHVDEWRDQRDVLAPTDVAVEVVEGWRMPTRGQLRRRLRLVGPMLAGSRIGPGDAPFAVYPAPAPFGEDDAPAAYRAHSWVSVVSAEEDAGTWTVELEERDPSGAGWSQVPIALTPPRPIPTTKQRAAILEWGERVAGSPDPVVDPMLDVLRRVPPRIAGGMPADGAPAERIVAALAAMDRSYLAVQGPPGSGKTHVGATVLRALVEHGWRIGVVAQSHDVVEHLLRRAIELGVPEDRVGKRPRSGSTSVPGVALQARDIPGFLAGEGGRILGGTSWTFANAEQVPRHALDLLVVDEAGQYSLADTIACSVAANRLLLLGDPQQLPQVSQGHHPEPIDASALGWLSDGHDVLPPGLGVFLAESWRMHPTLCDAVSALSYEGRLRAADVAARRVLAGPAPGVHVVDVAHEGNAVESREEAAAVVAIVREQLGRAWLDPSVADEPRPLTAADVIVVAPYNAQVDLLRRTLDAAGLTETRVGTVDRFQGQEAVIAIVSLTASSADDAPRGIDFVLQRNRINVAISRAQWAAYVVHSPRIADALPYRADGLAQLSGFLRLTGRS